jgi:alpha-glucosidase (family GH31 glycosyl hydrolase)
MHRQVTKELQYPWRYGEEALQNYRFFARLHARLFPYIYSYAKEASTTGLPIIRPLVLFNQTDGNTFSIQHTYLFGNEFLVAPMVTPNASARQVYLPTGNWFNFWTNERHPGGKNISWTNSQQAQMPLFVREGAIVPMLLTEVQTLCDANYVNNPNVKTPDSGLLFLVYPGAASQFTVYDGTNIQCEASGGNLTVTLSSVARPVVLQLLVDEPVAVVRDGTALVRLATPTEFDAADTGWRADAQARLVLIKFKHAGGTTKVTL